MMADAKNDPLTLKFVLVVQYQPG